MVYFEPLSSYDNIAFTYSLVALKTEILWKHVNGAKAEFGANDRTHRGVPKRVTHRKITLNSSDFWNDRQRSSSLMYHRFTGRISSGRKTVTKKWRRKGCLQQDRSIEDCCARLLCRNLFLARDWTSQWKGSAWSRASFYLRRHDKNTTSALDWTERLRLFSQEPTTD